MSARKKLMEDIYDQFLLCKICFDVYSRPKTLACLHTFCEACIAKQHDAERQRAYRSGQPDTTHFLNDPTQQPTYMSDQSQAFSQAFSSLSAY